MNDATPMTIADAGGQLRSGALTSLALVQHSFERMRQLESTFHAFISHDEELATRAAVQLDSELARGQDRGPLHGIPIGVKDNIATADFPTTFGSRIGRGHRTAEDAQVVHRLKAAGAIIVGKNNLHEFALGATNANAEYGDVPNPWDVSRAPGGSSGGSAAAVALGEVFASLGTDSGGSVRIPAAMCGLVGLKPTHGRVSLRGLLGGAPTIDHIGPMTRSVRDAAMVYDAIAGHDPHDPESLVGSPPPAQRDLGQGVDGVRIGVIANRSMGAVHEEVRAAVEVAAETLGGLGAAVAPVALPGVELGSHALVAVAYAEVSAVHREWIRTRRAEYSADIRRLIDVGQILSAQHYLSAQRGRRHLQRCLDEALREHDLLVLPTVALTAGARDGHLEPLEGDSGALALFTLIRFTGLFNMTGYPAISIPCGFDGRGLPIGLQLAGRPDSEPLLLRVAAAFEATQPFVAPGLVAQKGAA